MQMNYLRSKWQSETVGQKSLMCNNWNVPLQQRNMKEPVTHSKRTDSGNTSQDIPNLFAFYLNTPQRVYLFIYLASEPVQKSFSLRLGLGCVDGSLKGSSARFVSRRHTDEKWLDALLRTPVSICLGGLWKRGAPVNDSALYPHLLNRWSVIAGNTTEK